MGLWRYCLGGNGGGGEHKGETTNTGDVKLRFREGRGGAISGLLGIWLNDVSEEDGWTASRVGSVERGGGGGGVDGSWKQNKHKLYISLT